VKKVILSMAAFAALTGSAFAADTIETEHKTTMASIGVGAGHLHGNNGAIISADIVKTLSDKDTFLLTKIEANSDSFETKFELAKRINFIKSEVPVYFRGGIGYRSWTSLNTESVPAVAQGTNAAGIGTRTTNKEEHRQAIIGTVGVTTSAIAIPSAPVPMSVTPRAFIDHGVGNFDIGAGAGARVQSGGVFVDFEAKNMHTTDGSKNTARVVAGVSYIF
jgi:hypothetical protein